MKALIFSLIFTFFTLPIYAKNIELEISTKWIKGDKVRQYTSKVVAEIGSEITLPGNEANEMKIKILADDKIGPTRSIYLNNKIYEVKNDKELLVSNPKVIALLGKKATVFTESSTGEY